MVQRFAIGSFKGYAIDLNHLDQVAAAGHNRMVIQMPGIRQTVPCAWVQSCCFLGGRFHGLRPVTVAAPKIMRARAAATAYFRNPEIENPGLPQTGHIANRMNDAGCRNCPE